MTDTICRNHVLNPNPTPTLNRRNFLSKAGALAAGAALLAPGGRAAQAKQIEADDKHYDFLFTRVKFACDVHADGLWNQFPGAEQNVLRELSRTIRCSVKPQEDCETRSPKYGADYQFNNIVTFGELDAMRENPFLFMTGEQTYSPSAGERRNLKEYLRSGGFLMADDCIFGPQGDLFYQSCCRILRELFGPESVRRIPIQHEVMHNIHDLRSIGLPHCMGRNHGATGLFIGDRLAAFLSSTDLHCGWVIPGRIKFNKKNGKHGYKEAVAMAVNVIAYAMSH